MRMEGLEPPRAEAHQDLNLARIPVPPHPRDAVDCRPPTSALLPDELVEERHAAAVGDRDVARIGPGPADAEQVAVMAEDPADVRRQVGEEIAWILVVTRSATRQVDAEAIHAATPVRVNQASDQLTWIGARDPELPGPPARSRGCASCRGHAVERRMAAP